MQVLGPHEASHDKIKTLVGVGAENLVLEKSQGAAPDQSIRQGRRPHPDSDSTGARALNQVTPQGWCIRVWGRNRVLKRNRNKTPLLRNIKQNNENKNCPLNNLVLGHQGAWIKQRMMMVMMNRFTHSAKPLKAGRMVTHPFSGA